MTALQSGSLKRKYEEDAVYSSSSPSSHSEWDSDEESPQNETVDFGPVVPLSSSHHFQILPILKKTTETRSKSRVRFGLVTVFLFQRCQGFSSVPSHGGCTLGMVRQHAACQQFTLAEHAEEQHRLRMERLREQHQEERLEAMRQKLINSGTLTVAEAASLTISDVTDDDVELITKLKDGGSLRPYSSKRRRALLRSAGVARIDREEKRQLQELRQWRKDCGCDCRGFCEPETCACSQAGIKCQMDRGNFPCGCSKEGCGNPKGRIEFNSNLVRSHYIHTHMKIELEKRLPDERRIIVPESRERNNSVRFPTESNPSSFSPLSPGPSSHLSSEFCREDDSRSRDTTDTSCSSDLHLDLANGCPPTEQTTLDANNKGLAHILSFDYTDEDGCPYIKGYERINVHPPPNHNLCTEVSTNIKDDNPRTSQLEYVDENANQVTLECLDDIPNTPSPSSDQNGFMDLSLSSDSDLVFFDSFEHSPCLSHNHFKVYGNLDDTSHLQFPRCPSPAQIDDSGLSLLESLVGIS